ncbi:MAG: hypothetical protein QF454_01810 [Candidatus Thalassarchaeaceae archaeon]|jgi:hypothetical protein|nr:hypothetical protein [Candidatus Thalassarchaeaceae archaeon]
MKPRIFLLLAIFILLCPLVIQPTSLDVEKKFFGPEDDDDGDGVINSEDAYPNATVVLEKLDETRSRGAEPYEQNQTLAMELAALLWSDSDSDGWADQSGTALSDHCPTYPGESFRLRQGCGDIDGDGLPDEMDPDADGDGITNDLELAASTATHQYSIYDVTDVPPDRDYDGMPDVLDLDDDNDGWDDEIEIERGSDPFDSDSNPFNLYFGISTGTFYLSGEGFTQEPDDDAIEFSLSWLLSALSTELIIPIGLIPIYLFFWSVRKRNYRYYENLIVEANTLEELQEIELEVNKMVRERKLRTFQGLVLRNAIETRENEFSQDAHTEEE